MSNITGQGILPRRYHRLILRSFDPTGYESRPKFAINVTQEPDRDRHNHQVALLDLSNTVRGVVVY